MACKSVEYGCVFESFLFFPQHEIRWKLLTFNEQRNGNAITTPNSERRTEDRMRKDQDPTEENQKRPTTRKLHPTTRRNSELTNPATLVAPALLKQAFTRGCSTSSKDACLTSGRAGEGFPRRDRTPDQRYSFKSKLTKTASSVPRSHCSAAPALSPDFPAAPRSPPPARCTSF